MVHAHYDLQRLSQKIQNNVIIHKQIPLLLAVPEGHCVTQAFAVLNPLGQLA
jgi:hypothetical protein